MHIELLPQRHGQHGPEPGPFARDRPQSVHQSLKDSLLGIMIAVADTDPTGVAPDLGREKQKPQTGCRQRGVLQRFYFGLLLAVEQHQPTVQVVGQHRQLEVIAVHHPPPRGIRLQARIVVGFLDQVLRPGPLIVEPHQQIDGALDVGDEDPVGILGRVEQLVLLWLVGRRRLGLLFVTQGDEPIGLVPAFRLIVKLALAVGK